MCPETNLPSTSEKPSLLDWLEQYFNLPFRFPRIPLMRTAANLDKAAAAIVLAGGDNAVARIQASTDRLRAKSSAEVAFIQYGQANIQSSDQLAERALQYALGDAIAAQKNREEILRIATEDLKTDPPKDDAPQKIDDDWLDAFKRYAETKSNKDMQQLWGRILSAEIRKPGASSLRTLAFLSTVSSVDANFIVKAFTFTLEGTYIPSWFSEGKAPLPYADFLHLRELDIVNSTPGIGGAQWTKQSNEGQVEGSKTNFVYFAYYDKLYICENSTDPFSWQFPACPLSQIGRELFAITNTKIADHASIEQFLLGAKPAQATRVLSFNLLQVANHLEPAGISKIIFPIHGS